MYEPDLILKKTCTKLVRLGLEFKSHRDLASRIDLIETNNTSFGVFDLKFQFYDCKIGVRNDLNGSKVCVCAVMAPVVCWLLLCFGVKMKVYCRVWGHC